MGYRAVKDKQFQSWTFTRQAAVASAKAYALYLLPALLLLFSCKDSGRTMSIDIKLKRVDRIYREGVGGPFPPSLI